MSEPVILAPETIEQIARRVVDLMRGDAPESLIDATEVARRLGCSRSFVYDHLGDLGAVRVGGRWRFDPTAIDRPTEPPVEPNPPRPQPTARPRRRRQAKTPAGSPLLPVGGRSA